MTDRREQSPVPQAVVEGVAGAMGGIVATLLTYPLMTSATRQASSTSQKQEEEEENETQNGTQCHHDDDDGGGGGGGDHDGEEEEEEEGEGEGEEEGGDAKEHGQGATGKGVCYAVPKEEMPRVQEMLKKIRVLYSGLGASLFGTTVSQGVYFYFYSVLRGVAVKRRKRGAKGMELQVGESLAIASLAGMANVLLTNPIWMVATRMQTYRSLHTSHKKIGSPNALSVIKSIFSEYGLGGFWNGVGASLIMVINPTIQYALYEWLMSVRARIAIRPKKKTQRSSRPSTLQVFLMSALAKAGATVLTYPMLTVKTRMMSARKEDADIQYASVLDAVRQILNKEGVAGYYRGMSTKITQSILGAAILLVCKEKMTDISTTLLNSSRTKN